jgi:SAM-dependent methyltransferase
MAAAEDSEGAGATLLVALVRSRAAALPPLPAAEFAGWAASLTYGELIPAEAAAAVRRGLSLLSRTPPGGAAFVDLGSGEGWPCLIAAALFPAAFRDVRGVELVPQLVAAAERHRALAAAALPAGSAAAASVGGVKFECADLLEGLEGTLASADLVFFLGTCFEDDVLAPLWRACAAALHPGAILICASHEAPAPLFELCWQGVAAASWGGDVMLRFYRRVLCLCACGVSLPTITAPHETAAAAAPPPPDARPNAATTLLTTAGARPTYVVGSSNSSSLPPGSAPVTLASPFSAATKSGAPACALRISWATWRPSAPASAIMMRSAHWRPPPACRFSATAASSTASFPSTPPISVRM